MSTEAHWLDMSVEEREQTVTSLNNELSELIQVIRGQHECITDHGWHEVWCLECDQSSEPFEGLIEDAAAKFLADGWAVDSLERATAVCSACANAPDTSHYSSQYEDERGLLG